MSLPKFIFNDESKKNSHGFFLLNGGGIFDRFREYSVMLDNHDLDKLVGRWENLRVEGALLVADPVFDEGIALGAERKGQVERGFLRGASPGIIILKAEYRTNPAGGDDLYVTEWELFEGSVTSVPSNAGAVTLRIYTGDGHLIADNDVRLHVDNIVKLCAGSAQGKHSIINPMEKINLTAEAYVALGIDQEAPADAISAAIVKLHGDLKSAKEKIGQFEADAKAQLEKQAATLVDLAIKEGRITAENRADYVQLAISNYTLVQKTIQGIPAKVTLSGGINKIEGGSIPADRASWTLLHWIKDDPKGLENIKANDPEAYEVIRNVRN